MNSSRLQRWVPLLVWIAVPATFILIVFQILSYGFVPAGDARRHVAKVMTDKEYNQIVVLRPEYKIDHSPGWDWILRRLHRLAGWNEDKLMSFSVAAMMLCVFLAGLPWLRRPEAWMAALLAQMVAVPETMLRLDQGRPFLLSEGVLAGILFAWGRDRAEKPSWQKIVLTTAGFALSVWVHGTWYLWVFVLGGFLLAGAWRQALRLSGCWAAGVIAGALLSGKPAAFLYGAVYMAAAVYREHAPAWLLVGEFQPGDGEFYTLAVLALVYLWRRQQQSGRIPRDANAPCAAEPPRPSSPSPAQTCGTEGRGEEAGSQFMESGGLLRQPVFWMIAIFWTLGFQADRFWADWGLPAALVWLALQFDGWMAEEWPAESGRRLLFCGLLAAALFLDCTSDSKSRFTKNLREPFLDGSNPALQGWLPEGDGIFYSADMSFFYDTFYHNPQARWRYILGFEPALMPEEDLKILRNMQWNHWDWPTWQPWIQKMRPQDRVEIPNAGPPPIPELEWRAGADGLWIGRKPQGK
ncbi:MAG: hypothetical protein ABSC18_01290 [Verrucomicrobiota bacterium]|jgi:hypothetical protein